MNKVVFHLSLKAAIMISILVAGLLVFVWLHWRGQRQVELVVFSVLTVLATTLYTVRGEVYLTLPTREITGKRTWLGVPIRRIVVRVGSEDELHLTEDITHSTKGQGITVAHQLEASGQLLSHQSTEPGPYILISESHPKNRAMLEAFAKDASRCLGVPLNDTRRFTERLAEYRR
jgi:hypothetical protein